MVTLIREARFAPGNLAMTDQIRLNRLFQPVGQDKWVEFFRIFARLVGDQVACVTRDRKGPGGDVDHTIFHMILHLNFCIIAVARVNRNAARCRRIHERAHVQRWPAS